LFVIVTMIFQQNCVLRSIKNTFEKIQPKRS